MQKLWYLYILECEGDRLYTGITIDVEARYKAHASGRGAKFTRSYPPRRIVLVETHADRSAASKAEYAIKKLTSEAKRKLIADQQEPRMSDMQSLINRIDEIEIHLAHQDHVIDELNSVIARQWNEIEAMARRLAKLGDRVQVAEEHGNAPAPVEPPPPHY